MKQYKHVLLPSILVIAIIVRFYGFNNPIADWHSWRQADTSAVSRNFVKDGFDVFHPKFDDLSNVPSGKDNPEGYRFVEFPMYNILQAGLFMVFGILSLEQWGRVVTIAASVTTTFLLYLLVKKYGGEKAGLLTAFFYAFLPYSIYYGRVILPDTSMVTASIACIYFVDRWLFDTKSNTVFFLLAMFSGAVALLLKPYAAFFMLPVLYLFFRKYRFTAIISWKAWLFFVVVATPLILWRVWMTQFPEGIPANTWLLNGNGIRFRPAFFRWIVYERTVKLIAGFTGSLFLLAGGVSLIQQKNVGFVLSFLLGSFLYLTIFATGNVQHDYYQILIMPTIAMTMGLGAAWLWSLKKPLIPSSVLQALVIIGIISGFFISWKYVKDYFNINNHAIMTAGTYVDLNTPKDAKVIANYNGDTSFLYQTNRKGWASYQKPIDEMRDTLGADYLVLANPVPGDYEFAKTYKLIKEGENFLLFDLHQKP